jgi:hypothetical protein
MDYEEHDHENGVQAGKRVVIRGMISPISSTVLLSSASISYRLPDTELDQRRSVIIYNSDTLNSVWIGDNTVSSSNGIKLYPDEKIMLDVQKDLFARGSNDNITLHILEFK